MKHLQKILWAVVAIALIGFIALNLPQNTDATSGDAPVGMPIAGYNKGVHFQLTDQNGAPFNSATDIPDGSYALIFFGFTHCPVICPTELQKFAAALDMLPADKADKIIPLFITIDPERDTVEAMQEYVPMFHNKIIGLTGETETVHKVLNDWKVYFNKVEDPQYTEYTMDHSTYSYLVDKDMNIVALYRMKVTPQQLVDSITNIVQ